jgi:hypothetical protein
MDDQASVLLRWLRAAVLTAVVVSFGTLAHVSADGRLPGWVGMGTLVSLCLIVSSVALTAPAGASGSSRSPFSGRPASTWC